MFPDLLFVQAPRAPPPRWACLTIYEPVLCIFVHVAFDQVLFVNITIMFTAMVSSLERVFVSRAGTDRVITVNLLVFLAGTVGLVMTLEIPGTPQWLALATRVRAWIASLALATVRY